MSYFDITGLSTGRLCSVCAHSTHRGRKFCGKSMSPNTVCGCDGRSMTASLDAVLDRVAEVRQRAELEMLTGIKLTIPEGDGMSESEDPTKFENDGLPRAWLYHNLKPDVLEACKEKARSRMKQGNLVACMTMLDELRKAGAQATGYGLLAAAASKSDEMTKAFIEGF